MSSQMLKGILQGIMLIILAKKPDYGYGISKQLNDYGLADVPKGTIYPLLAAMERRGLITGKMHPSQDGPDRKYYELTSSGEAAKQAFIMEWDILANVVNRTIDRAGKNENNSND